MTKVAKTAAGQLYGNALVPKTSVLVVLDMPTDKDDKFLLAGSKGDPIRGAAKTDIDGAHASVKLAGLKESRTYRLLHKRAAGTHGHDVFAPELGELSVHFMTSTGARPGPAPGPSLTQVVKSPPKTSDDQLRAPPLDFTEVKP